MRLERRGIIGFGFDDSQLREQVDKTVAQLRELGVDRNDAVAIVLPNGPEMASAFISIAAGATTAPLDRPDAALDSDNE